MALITRSLHSPVAQIQRDSCPCWVAPTLRVSSLPPGERHWLVEDFATMRLVHRSKAGAIKNALPLDTIHHELEINSLALAGSGSANILLCKMSFDCLVRTQEGDELRDYLSFDLKIPGAGTPGESVFTYDLIEQKYGTKAALYAGMHFFYNQGRAQFLGQAAHGHQPNYNPQESGHDQYIRHTEQLLVAYLALPEASTMLAKRLKAEIRGKYPSSCAVKVYNIGLHMHSSKSCCAPCEYSLLGLMNTPTATFRNKTFGLLANFQKEAADLSSETLAFSFPQQSPFRLLVTASVFGPDADHKKLPTFRDRLLQAQEEVPTTDILVKTPPVSRHIYTSYFNSGFDQRKVPEEASLQDTTVGISGSKKTPGSTRTAKKTTALRGVEGTQLAKSMALLTIAQENPV